MADETSTTTSEQTTETTATTDAATTGASDTVAETSTEAKADDLGTALGGAGEETKEAETEGATVPEAYELAVPEGFEKLDEETVAAATPIFKELGLTNEQANKLVPIAGQLAQKIVADRDQQFLGTIVAQRKEWLETAKADEEIGGQNWDASITASARALDRLGFPKGSPLRVALDESGFGNHPEMLRAFARVGKAIGEDSDFVRGDAAAAVKPKSDAELFYGTQKQEG